MARVTFGTGPSLILSNLFEGSSTGNTSKTSFDMLVDQPIGGGSTSGVITFDGKGFKFNDGHVSAGRINEITFTGEADGDSGLSMRIVGLDLKATDLFDVLDGDFGTATLQSLVDLLFDGDDIVLGGPVGDLVYPGAGDDRIVLVGGNDRVIAGLGDDTIDGGLDTPTPFTQTLGDVVNYAFMTGGVDLDLERGTAVKPGGGGVDRLIDIETVIGSAFADTLKGDGGDNVLAGAAGADVIDGRGGTDIAVFDGFENGGPANYRIDLAKGRAVNQDGVVDKLKSVEGAIGGSGDDTLIGDGRDNVLNGGSGGTDRLTGGGGADHFVFTNGFVTIDPKVRVTDFKSGVDTLAFDQSAFGLTDQVKVIVDDGKGYEITGKLSTFVLRLSDGHLMYDRDGKGPADFEEFAILDKVTTLKASDFELF